VDLYLCNYSNTNERSYIDLETTYGNHLNDTQKIHTYRIYDTILKIHHP